MKFQLKTIGLLALFIFGAQFSFAQTKPTKLSKNELVKQIVNSSIEATPYVGTEKKIRQTSEENLVDFNRMISEGVSKKLEQNQDLSAEKRAELKARAPEFSRNMAQQLNDLFSKDVPVKSWFLESLTANFSKGFTVTELQKIANFLKSPAGKSFIGGLQKAFSNFDKSTEPELEKRYENQIALFIVSPVGKKYLNTLSDKANAETKVKMDEWTSEAMVNAEAKMKDILMQLENFVQGKV